MSRTLMHAWPVPGFSVHPVQVERQIMASPPLAVDPFAVELAELRKSWYTSISPRDRTFVHAVRNTALGLIDSIINDLTATQQAREDAVSRIRELALEAGPTILDRHITAFKRAQEDCLVDRQVQALSNGSEQFMDGKVDSDKSPPPTSTTVLAQRYHHHAPHPGIVASSLNPSQTRKPGILETQSAHPADAQLLERPVTPQGIDESLADALSSSITGLPGRTALLEPPGSNQQSDEYPRHGTSLLYEPSPAYLSALIDRILKAHLPPNDYASTAERAMITEIIANTILGNILRKCSEPWFLWRIGLSWMEAAEEENFPGKEGMLEKGGLVGEKLVTSDRTAVFEKQPLNKESNILGLTPFYVDIISRLSSMFANAGWRCLTIASKWLQQRIYSDPETETSSSPPTPPPCKPNKHILEPWLDVLTSLTSAGSSYGKQELCNVTRMAYTIGANTADRQVVDKTLCIDTATKIVTKLTDILFPDGQPATSIPDPSPGEAEEMKRSLERRIWAKTPHIVVAIALARFLILGRNEAAQRQTITDAFEVFSNASANTTVLLTLVESAIFDLLPGMGSKTQNITVDGSP
ncbi:hypothetical protein QFC21_004655 [Naganishia friedmannii]|uniref:Uncharacterized protein n=1 Tax=Naganishia friedmannii TaxID=89922 RepID=A0ACC2VF76_9TREE|nr:hypothetical protein QFC21_004655 [Naganishia friedmannii]